MQAKVAQCPNPGAGTRPRERKRTFSMDGTAELKWIALQPGQRQFPI